MNKKTIEDYEIKIKEAELETNMIDSRCEQNVQGFWKRLKFCIRYLFNL